MCTEPLPGYQGHMMTNARHTFREVLHFSLCEVVKGDSGERERNIRDKGRGGGCLITSNGPIHLVN